MGAADKEVVKLSARLTQIRSEAAVVAANAKTGSETLRASNLAEEACQHAARLIEIMGG
jgi:hypothetical protein